MVVRRMLRLQFAATASYGGPQFEEGLARLDPTDIRFAALQTAALSLHDLDDFDIL